MKCFSCHGKGHVMDGLMATAALFAIMLAPFILWDRNDPNGLTRKTCKRCHGTGAMNRKRLNTWRRKQ
jgi:DnaJ-class molecular chaperone